MGLRNDVGSPCDKTWTGKHTETCGHGITESGEVIDLDERDAQFIASVHYQMWCKNCDDQTKAYQSGDDFVCIICGYTTDAESGNIFDVDEANYYAAEYRGMKQAGFFKEKWEQEEERLFNE